MIGQYSYPTIMDSDYTKLAKPLGISGFPQTLNIGRWKFSPDFCRPAAIRLHRKTSKRRTHSQSEGPNEKIDLTTACHPTELLGLCQDSNNGI